MCDSVTMESHVACALLTLGARQAQARHTAVTGLLKLLQSSMMGLLSVTAVHYNMLYRFPAETAHPPLYKNIPAC